MCTYCPQTALKNAYNSDKYMSLENLILMLNTVPKDVGITFAGFSEPWANPICNDILKHVLEQGYKISVYTTLYGLSKEGTDFAIALLSKHEKQVKEIWLHLPDAHNNMPGWKYSDDWQYAYEAFSKLSAHSMTLSSTTNVDNSIDVIDNVSSWYLHTRADNLDLNNIEGQHVTKPAHNEFPIECTRHKDYQANVLLPNGDVALCCMDYGLKHIIGNLLTQNYNEVINGPEISNIATLNKMEGFSNDTLCRTCNDTYCKTPYNTENYYELYPEHKK